MDRSDGQVKHPIQWQTGIMETLNCSQVESERCLGTLLVAVLRHACFLGERQIGFSVGARALVLGSAQRQAPSRMHWISAVGLVTPVSCLRSSQARCEVVDPMRRDSHEVVLISFIPRRLFIVLELMNSNVHGEEG